MRVGLAGTAAVALLAAGSAAAQTSEAPAAVSEVVVTGHKDINSAGQVSITANAGVLGNRDQFETPFSQASYTDKLVLDQQARTLDEVLDNNSSVRDTSNSYSDAEQFNIRGFSSQPQSVLFNGVPGLISARRIPVEGIGRVDILLGPSALLYNGVGDQNVGGVINIQPKRADAAPLTRGIASYVSDTSGELQADVGRRFGQDGTFGVRANVAGLTGDSPIDNQYQRQTFGSGALDVKTDRLTASLDVMADDYLLLANVANLRPQAGAPIPRAPDNSLNVFDRSSSFEERNSLALLRADYRLTGWLTLSAAYGHSLSTERYQGPYALGLTGPNGAARALVIPFFARSESDVGQVSARATFRTGPLTHEVTLSGDFYASDHGSAYSIGQLLTTNIYAPTPFKPRIVSNPKPDTSIGDNSASERNSFAASDIITALDGRLTLIGGLRQQSIDDRNIDAATGVTTDRYEESAVTPAGAAIFKVTPRFSVYGNYIQALQSGPSAPNLVANAGQVFPPFRAEQLEGGVKWDLRGLGLTAAVFQITQPSAYIDTRSNLFVVNGEARNRGVELNAFGSIRPGLRLLSGVSYFDAEQNRTGDPTTEGKLAIGIPHWQVNLGAEWDVPRSAGLTLIGRVIHTSEEAVDAVNSQHIPGWTRVDVGARYALTLAGRPTTIRFDIRNVADDSYWQDATQGLLYAGAPRTFRVSVATDF